MPTDTPVLKLVESEVIPTWIQPYVPFGLNLLYGFIILMVGWALSKWAHRAILTGLRKAKVEEALARFLATVAQYCVLAATLISALNRVGIQTTSLVALLASAGLAIGLALQGSLSSFASGVMILFFRPFMLGDLVSLSGNLGVVDDIGMFQTTLAALEGEKVFLPNSSVMNNAIINYTARGVRRATIEVGVAYGSDVPEVLGILKAAAAKVETGIEEPAPLFAFQNMGASSLDFKVGLWCAAPDFGGTLTDLRRCIYEELNAAGIEIPFPQMVLHKAEPEHPEQAD